MILRAKCGNNGLLQNEQIQKIGKVIKGKKYSREGILIETSKVCFHFGYDMMDVFYFENDTLIYSELSYKTPGYLLEIYKNLALMEKVNQEILISKITCEYVFIELGFGDWYPSPKND